MENFWFYTQLGLNHVLDISAYDHILFLAALTVPFDLKQWRSILLLATFFTIAHCTSLALSVFDILVMDIALIEFLIPVTICLTAIFNLFYASANEFNKNIILHVLAVNFFGLIHGFGFSNYFRMLVAEEEEKMTSLFAFATGIELSQLIVILVVLFFAYLIESVLKVQKSFFVIAASILILLITIPMLIETFPWLHLA